MAEPMTPERLAEIKASIERAHTEIGEVCAEGPAKRWRWSIPANPDRDTDLIVADALKGAEDLLADVDRLTAALVDLDREASLAGQALAEKTINCEALSEFLSDIADLLDVPEMPEQAAGERWGTATRLLAEMVADGKAVR